MEPQLAALGGLGALLMGITLGVFGAGGSILTVPLLAFVFDYPPVQASHYSLLVVGLVSATGIARQWSSGALPIRKALSFALPAMAGMFLVKGLLLPALPPLISLQGMPPFTLDQLLLWTFAVVMILAAGSMLFVRIRDEERDIRGVRERILLAATGLGTGAVSGLVGAGGGFLIVPALVFLGGLPVKEASRTSLLVITLNSLWGFAVGTRAWASIPIFPLLLVIALALAGMALGLRLQDRVPAGRLKPAFGLFVLLTGILILIKTSH